MYTNLETTLIVKGPVISKSSAASTFGIDAPMAQNDKGEFILPDTLIKGKLRQAFEELKEATDEAFITDGDIITLLGKRTGNAKVNGDRKPKRGKIIISDFVCAQCADKPEGARYRIKIDSERGSVQHGGLMIIQSPFNSGELVSFKGNIIFYSENETEKNKIVNHISQGLRFIQSFGSQRTIGFGRLLDVKIEEKTELEIQTAPMGLNDVEQFKIALKFDSPFCLAKRQIDGNLFESTIEIPGAALKGAFASTWNSMVGKMPSDEINCNTDDKRKKLGECFDKIRFTHAFPENLKGKNWTTIPKSLAFAGNRSYDLALIKKPCLLNNDKNEKVAPAFQIDWKGKEWAKACEEFGMPKINKELRVRTALDREKRRHKEEHLFAYEMIDPGCTKWLFSIDLGLVPENERLEIKEQMTNLLYEMNKLCFIGKTDATASMEANISTTDSLTDIFPINECYVVVLKTPAVLCNPEILKTEGHTKEALHSAYKVVFNELSGNKLTLDNYFTSQSFGGGDYIYNRFQRGKPYQPFLLTDAGSVFVFKKSENTTEEDAAAAIKQWIEHGLKLPDWAVKKYGGTWKECPFIPENGYGEVMLNNEVKTLKEDEYVIL